MSSPPVSCTYGKEMPPHHHMWWYLVGLLSQGREQHERTASILVSWKIGCTTLGRQKCYTFKLLKSIKMPFPTNADGVFFNLLQQWIFLKPFHLYLCSKSIWLETIILYSFHGTYTMLYLML